ncbi:hypothetical protein ACFLJF_005370 [Salmonella enterica]
MYIIELKLKDIEESISDSEYFTVSEDEYFSAEEFSSMYLLPTKLDSSDVSGSKYSL